LIVASSVDRLVVGCRLGFLAPPPLPPGREGRLSGICVVSNNVETTESSRL
jgi:hypothetical protein